MIIIVLLGVLVLLINIPRLKHEKSKEKLYACISGDFKGQVHDISTWRKIGQDLAQNKTIKIKIKYASDENLLGLLYINYGINLDD